MSPVTLQVSDATGSMTTTKVLDKSPFAKELLVRDDCFILDNGANGKVFVWKGNGANAEEKQVALQMADNFIEQMNYPRMKTQVLQLTCIKMNCCHIYCTCFSIGQYEQPAGSSSDLR